MSKEYYVQCLLEKKIQDGFHYKTSWIPEKFAVLNKYITLKGDDGWKVYKIYGKEEKKTIEQNERSYTKHREATDI